MISIGGKHNKKKNKLEVIRAGDIKYLKNSLMG